mgnify:CR=1 FL=1
MMKNKVKLKRYLLITAVIFLLFTAMAVVFNVYEYRTYTKNYNEKLEAIIETVKEKYPDVSDAEIIEILNSDKSSGEFLRRYILDIEKDSAVLINDKIHQRLFWINILIVISFGVFLLVVFLIFNRRKDKEISEITRYIEEINRKNYELHIDDMSEDELSILKNEVYKTTVMLKESADNSLKDKRNLKKSLEDISHQLKTPITSILVILDNLIEEPDMDEALREDFIRDIKRETTNINFLVQSILKLSKFDADTINFIKDEVLLKDIVGKAAQNVSTLCDLKNITLNIKGDDSAGITCDFRWQTEAVTNIIKNCIEHSEYGSSIDVAYSKNNVYSMISVRDYGSGISDEDLPHIFERFYKGENASKDSVGIGLALSKTIIEEDNGHINVTSDESGTLFEIKYFIL